MLRTLVLLALIAGPQGLLAMKSMMMDLPEGAGANSYFPHAGASGTHHNRPTHDEDFFKTNSEMPLLPTIHGYFGTHGNSRRDTSKSLNKHIQLNPAIMDPPVKEIRL